MNPTVKITFWNATGSTWTSDAPIGTTLMQAAVSEGVDGIVAECGGNAMCATCHVYISTEQDQSSTLPEIGAEEDDMLDCAEAERRTTSRLSCQLPVTEELDGLQVEVPTSAG